MTHRFLRISILAVTLSFPLAGPIEAFPEFGDDCLRCHSDLRGNPRALTTTGRNVLERIQERVAEGSQNGDTGTTGATTPASNDDDDSRREADPPPARDERPDDGVERTEDEGPSSVAASPGEDDSGSSRDTTAPTTDSAGPEGEATRTASAPAEDETTPPADGVALPREPPPPPPPPILNSYGIPVGGVTDGEIQSLAMQWFQTQFRPSRTPPAEGMSMDEWGIWVGGAQGVQHIGGIDGFTSPGDYWMRHGAYDYVLRLLQQREQERLAASSPPVSGGPTSSAASPGKPPNGPARSSEDVPDVGGDGDSGGAADQGRARNQDSGPARPVRTADGGVTGVTSRTTTTNGSDADSARGGTVNLPTSSSNSNVLSGTNIGGTMFPTGVFGGAGAGSGNNSFSTNATR